MVGGILLQQRSIAVLLPLQVTQFRTVWRAARTGASQGNGRPVCKNDLLFSALFVYLENKMTNVPRQFYSFTYRYWHSIAALADGPVHI